MTERCVATSKFREIAIAITCHLVHGQTDRGAITGVVADPANAAVPDASIAAHNLTTGVDFRTTAAGTGTYTLPSLPPASIG